ncbi:GNAT family N-acetyltransferase [Cognatiyoonia sp. IB215446]|uniref:GNAT family N-acetyltransferase n=1 Tax=Cognatiyoonia sp. IB215446 TaxID=3097355 RepID=UPI002A11474D|nr:GNAT family N-acetyltransferase [Cognatiyoonia sp. IB215446]MDX8349906.1 GNAT family N-acetyltransferase [Cognatiyoonia sp. IB215446]
MILRAAMKADIAPIARIMGDWRAETPYIPDLHSREEDVAFIRGVVASQDVLVAEKADDVLGFIARDDREISQLFLTSSARGQGIGSALLSNMKERVAHLTLWCFQANLGARRFYQRHGFKIAFMTGGQDNAERQPDIRYQWSRSS